MSATPAREVTSTQVAGITFGFYSDDEVSQSFMDDRRTTATPTRGRSRPQQWHCSLFCAT